MQWITIATPPFEAIEKFDKLTSSHEEPDGLEARYVGTAEDGTLRIVAVWESKAHADRFFADVLPDALRRALGPEPLGSPQLTGFQVARSYARQPVA